MGKIIHVVIGRAWIEHLFFFFLSMYDQNNRALSFVHINGFTALELFRRRKKK